MNVILRNIMLSRRIVYTIVPPRFSLVRAPVRRGHKVEIIVIIARFRGDIAILMLQRLQNVEHTLNWLRNEVFRDS